MRGQGGRPPDRAHPLDDGLRHTVAPLGTTRHVEPTPRVGNRDAHTVPSSDDLNTALGGLARIRGIGTGVHADIVERLVGRGAQSAPHVARNPPLARGQVQRHAPMRLPGCDEGLEHTAQLRGIHGGVGRRVGNQRTQSGIGARARIGAGDPRFERENQRGEHVVVDESVAACPRAAPGALDGQGPLGVTGAATRLVEASNGRQRPLKHSRVSHSDE